MDEHTFNFTSSENLLSVAPQLSNFDAIKQWESSARNEIAKADNYLHFLDDSTENLKSELKQTKNEFSSKSFFKRLLSSDSSSQKIAYALRKNSESRNNILVIKEKFEYWLSLLPEDAAEAKQMLNELKLAKKELAVRKKELAGEMREIRSTARTKNASISNQAIFSNPKLRKIQRASVRITKEKNLKPNEQESFEIERQIVEIDKMINWIEKIRNS